MLSAELLRVLSRGVQIDGPARRIEALYPYCRPIGIAAVTIAAVPHLIKMGLWATH